MTSADSRADSPAERGLRWPAEWEPHAATWLSWPHNTQTWPGRLEKAESAFVEIVRALAGREQIHINVNDAAAEAHVRGLLAEARVDSEPGIRFFEIETDDAWVRDHGPLFLCGRDGGERVILDFDFDAWGGKYAPWDRDDAVPRKVAESLDIERFAPGFVLEGGSIDGNGRGCILTTEACLLNPNRWRGVVPDRAVVEERLATWLGCERVLWLGEGVVGDDTDGHVDDVARFVAPNHVVAADEPDPNAPNHLPLRENMRRLESMRDAEGQQVEVTRLPMPPALSVPNDLAAEFPAPVLPASYANFYLANEVALVPVFGAPSDDEALATLEGCLPGREVVPIDARDLVLGLGAVHCVTQQMPGISGE